jgi:hypothetical protein
LTQQFVVDAYAKVEESNLNYQRNNQLQLRADLYQGLNDAFDANDHGYGARAGHRVVLASSFVGGPRYMMQPLMQQAHAQSQGTVQLPS